MYSGTVKWSLYLLKVGRRPKILRYNTGVIVENSSSGYSTVRLLKNSCLSRIVNIGRNGWNHEVFEPIEHSIFCRSRNGMTANGMTSSESETNGMTGMTDSFKIPAPFGRYWKNEQGKSRKGMTGNGMTRTGFQTKGMTKVQSYHLMVWQRYYDPPPILELMTRRRMGAELSENSG